MEVGVNKQRNLLLFIALGAAIATPALGQTVTLGGGPASGETSGTAAIPQFTGVLDTPGLSLV